jgi:hypothetical protein
MKAKIHTPLTPTIRAAGRKLPNFVAVGPPRTATTWLNRVLQGHVSLPEGIKETKFFTSNFSCGMAWYGKHFRNSIAGLPIGEICPPYFASALARERIAQNLPGCAIICTLRDPVARLYSDYHQHQRLGWLGGVRLEEMFTQNRRSRRLARVVEPSRYAKHLKSWFDKFGRENVMTIIYDDLIADPQRYLDQFCRFVGIAPIDLSRSSMGDVRVNASASWRNPRSAWLAWSGHTAKLFVQRHRFYSLSKRLQPLWNFCSGGGEEFEPIDPDLEAKIRKYFRPDVETLEEMLHRDLSAWK